MKICYLGENISVHNQRWIRALADRADIELHVVAFERGVCFDRVTYHYLRNITGTKADYVLNIPLLRKYLQQIRPDVLHAQYATSYGFMAARCNFHPLVITSWGADVFDSAKNFWMKKMLRYSFGKADALTVLSKITRNEMSKLTSKPVELVPFGVDINRFIPAKKNDDGRIRIGTVRTLNPKYGVEYLIRAFAILAKDDPRLLLEIVGDGELRESLQQLSVSSGISDRVVFHGYINQELEFEKYYSILSRLDIFAILSVLDSESFGVASVEASACGLPVVATRVGGLPEVVLNGETGILVPPRDVEQTTASLKKLVDNPKLRENMGKAGRNLVCTHYNWQKCVQKMVDIYTSL